MIYQAERLVDTLPDSTVRLIDSVLRMPVSFSERERMDMALLQAEALFGCRDGARTVSNDTNSDTLRDDACTVSTISPIMDDDFFDNHGNISTSPELERAAAYYAKKKQYDKAAYAALYSGFVQQHYGEKETAMRSFKEAEQYGGIVGDSLTVAQAEYWMGKMLFNDYMEDEAVVLLKSADTRFGTHYTEHAYTQNMLAIAYIVLKQFEEAEACLNQSVVFSEMGMSVKAKRKTLNNYAVLYRLQGKYDQALDCLRQTKDTSDSTRLTLYYLNVGKVMYASGELDSAFYYYQQLEPLLPTANVKDETKVSAYGALSRFAESQNNVSLALQYRKQYDKILDEVRDHTEQRIVYGIQQKYDHKALQNTMNQRIIKRQRIIIFISVVAIVGLVALAISRIRLAKIRKQESEAKANLFHFMQQHRELQQKHECSEKAVLDLSMIHESDKKAYHDLIQKYNETENACLNYAQQLSDALNKEALVMRKLGIYMDNTGEKAYWVALKDAVFGGKDQWDALMKVFDTLYPDVRNNIALRYPDLTEMEQKDFILSYFNVSREDEALMFKKSVHLVDKWRNGVRKKMQAKEEKHD